MSPEFEKYFAQFPVEIRERLDITYQLLKKTCKGCEEHMAYGMPAFRSTENIVYFAGYKNHLGFYPTPKPIEHFAEQLKSYKTSKGAIQFPHNQPLPLKLMEEIVKWRMGSANQ
ncbi:MAG: hypothetical protein RL609_85 [Bacteroidota bacterium]|jgi:uncharacterized protein YdhG (YjbR/CyaY superfamily)